MFRARPSFLLATVVLAASACSDQVTTAPESSAAPDPSLGVVVASTAMELQSALDAAGENHRYGLVRLTGDVVLSEPLSYDSPAPLRIDGNGYTIFGPDVVIPAPLPSGDRVGEPSGGDALVVKGGGNLDIRDLTIRGASGNGIYLEVPGGARGLVGVVLRNTHLVGNGLAGAWIEEQAGARGPINSRATISLDVSKSSVTGNGFAGDGEGFADFDGIRVNEGGEGSIRVRIRDSAFDDNAGDGIELDEKGAGSVRAHVVRSSFDGNGAQPQFPDDLEDGFDIDEAGEGGIAVVMRDVTANDSFDEGIDLDEEGAGDVALWLRNVVASGSSDENIKVSEDADLEDVAIPLSGGGSVIFQFVNVTANQSTDDGVQLEEFGPGDLRGTLRESTVRENGDDGLDLTQAGDGSGRVLIIESDIDDNADDDVNADGVTVVGGP